MRYHFRTVTWRFAESSERPDSLKNCKSVTVGSPADLAGSYRDLFKDQVRERFCVFWLNSANRVLGFEVVTEGTLNSSLVHPREVFRGAIVATAASIIVAHNHPSDNSNPSQEDIAITRQIVESGRIVGIPVHDHIIFGGSGFYSFAEHGLI